MTATFVAASPDWPVPRHVRALATGRRGGVSDGPFASLNLGDHVGDDPARVAANRGRLSDAAGLPSAPLWLRQVHGIDVLRAGAGDPATPADASVAGPDQPDAVLAILTADCLPVLFCSDDGRFIGAAHGGWRGLASGVLEATVAALRGLGADPARLLAWLGPAIGPASYEVGPEVRSAFLAADPGAAGAFAPGRADRFTLDLYAAARRRLQAAGVHPVHGGGLCTLADPDRYFSHRRSTLADGAGATCGRQATLIWRARPQVQPGRLK